MYEIGKFELAIEDILNKTREYRIEYEILKRRLERLKELLLEWQNLDSRTKSNETSTTGYAVIKFANGFKTKRPVQLERLFIESPNSQQPENNDPLRDCMDKLRSAANAVSIQNFITDIEK